jgi:hypothetical protein
MLQLRHTATALSRQIDDVVHSDSTVHIPRAKLEEVLLDAQVYEKRRV